MSADIELDGKLGGGSVLRVGVPLALALGKSLHITDVRHTRLRRGIQEQHLSGLHLMRTISNAEYIGDHIGSTEIFVTPGTYEFDISSLPLVKIPTSGAVSLVYQTLTNYAFASQKPVGFVFSGGGSHVQFSPNFDVLTHVNYPIFKLFGLETAIQLEKPGFYPKGGAKGKILMRPVPHGKLELEEGEMEELVVIASSSDHYRAERVAERLIKGFKSKASPTQEYAGYSPADCKGAAISAILKYDTGLAKAIARVYQSKLDPEELGRTTAVAAKKIAYNEAAVDEQLADQLVLPLAFAPSGSYYTFDRMYQHVSTNIAVVEAILGDIFEVEQRESHFRITRK